MSSERQPRPFFDRFQKLMGRMDTTSIRWWAETIDACRAALVESRAARIDNPYGDGLTVWVWSGLGMEAAGQLLSTMVDIDGPMDESLALDLALRVTTDS